jgi:hypothetical protein
LPLFQLTESELVSIFVAQALEAYKGTAFEQPLRTAFQKLQAATNSPGTKISISWEDLDSAISFRHFDAYLPNAKIFTDLAKAVQNEEVVEFEYKKLMPRPMKNELLNPGTWRAFRVNGICSAMTKRAQLGGSLFWPGCGTSVPQSGSFPHPDRAMPTFKSSSRTAFRSGKPKTRNSSRSFCASLGAPHNWSANETGIPVNESKS